MSHKATEQALASLLPTLAEDLPNELVRHAASLLAQSRSFGGSLKPEAEIARVYVCAELACKSLSKSLKLPNPISRPPCAPKAYKKLYDYWEQTLLKSSAVGKRQEKKEIAQRTTRASVRNSATAAPVTPTKPTIKKVETPSKSLKRPRGTILDTTTLNVSTRIPDAPAWTMPVIRKICKTLNPQVQRLTFTAPPDVSSAFPPHVFAGLSSIIAFATADHRDMPSELEEEYSSQLCALYLEEMEPEDEMFRNEVIIVLITVYLMVVVRMLGIEVDKDLKAISIPGSRRLTKTMIHEMAVAALKVAGLLPTQKLLNEVDSWIKIIVLSNWMHGREWFENIPSLGDGAETAERGGIFPDLTDDEDGVVSPKKRRLLNRYVTKAKKPSSRGWDEVARLLPGLGTMMHSRVDWSSEENAERYIGWKEDIMEWISKIERE